MQRGPGGLPACIAPPLAPHHQRVLTKVTPGPGPPAAATCSAPCTWPPALGATLLQQAPTSHPAVTRGMGASLSMGKSAQTRARTRRPQGVPKGKRPESLEGRARKGTGLSLRLHLAFKGHPTPHFCTCGSVSWYLLASHVSTPWLQLFSGLEGSPLQVPSGSSRSFSSGVTSSRRPSHAHPSHHDPLPRLSPLLAMSCPPREPP